ncbi:hypothetical protein MUP01_12180 [Candidatus Bathyarchaeota archaeon]|nr:hypothetical protein [Candidatus Bathyarchaeota archaeon]
MADKILEQHRREKHPRFPTGKTRVKWRCTAHARLCEHYHRGICKAPEEYKCGYKPFRKESE